MTTAHSAPSIPVTDDVELTQRWADLLTPGPLEGHTLWLAWLRPDGTMVPTLVPIDEVPEHGTLTLVSGLLALHDAVAESERCDPDDLHLTLTLERPGQLAEDPTERDEEWLDLLDEAVTPMLDQGCSFHVFDGRSVQQLISRRVWPQRRG
ncbi:hypothetical protein [Modestobacter excelsi]|uniref:hypothetical protein n=1 Tax=Modestobacter excelsi TaxID=2213161 RepID=UPI00110C97A4|nr:hypothetical protein [Modestobacter excelsi]